MEPLQQMSVDLISKYNSGVWKPLYCTTEKIVALALIALRKQPALIVVDSSFVWKKWVECIEKRLGIKAADVGKIADGRIRLGEKITVAMVQTLHKRTAEVAPHIGQLILDGSHIGRVTIMKYLQAISKKP